MTFSLVRGRAMRATRLNGCGNPVLGAKSVVKTKGFVSVGLTANTVQADAISVTNANGDECISDTPAPRFKNYTVVISFCGVDPELFSMLSGQPVVYDANDLPVGFRNEAGVDVDLIGFALEVWSTVPGAACDEEGNQEFGYSLLPFISGGVLGDVSYENAAINFSLTGAVTKDGSGWGVGPYEVTRDESGDPAPLLTMIGSKTHLHVEKVSVQPPTAEGGAEALGSMATGASVDVTNPATLTPSNTYAPLNVAEANDVELTADPSTAWTTGQYVVFADGSEGHWSGTAWVAGRA